MIMTTAPMRRRLLAHRPSKLRIVTPLGDVEQWRLVRLDP